MSTETAARPRGTFPHGVHPPEGKEFAENAALEVLPTPKAVTVPLAQHLGAPAQPVVKPRQEVACGEQIGEAAGFISAAVHAPLAGKTGMFTNATLPNGRHVPAIPITVGEGNLAGDELREDLFGGDWSPDPADHDMQAVQDAVYAAGIVGLGGAAFPTHVKLARNEKKPIDTVLVNGCECEPYLTADYRLMVEHAACVIAGSILAAHANAAGRLIVVIEDNKPAAVEAMREALTRANTGEIDASIAVVKTKYPQGGEKQAILAVTGRAVPGGGLPLDVGVVVVNVGTAAAIAQAVLRGKPLTHRVICVTGPGVSQPKNLIAPIGVSYGELLAACGGLTGEAVRVIAGGPMMGFAVGDLAAPVTKGTSGVTVLTAAEADKARETACLRCGQCVDACPVNLVPTRIALACRNADWDLAKKYHINSCIECGCCAYTCPASIPLVQLIRTGKAQMPRD